MFSDACAVTWAFIVKENIVNAIVVSNSGEIHRAARLRTQKGGRPFLRSGA